MVTALGEPAELWENVTPGDDTWLIVKLIGAKSNRDGIGTSGWAISGEGADPHNCFDESGATDARVGCKFTKYTAITPDNAIKLPA